ncbi:hypothetical protein [Kitasatospora sp. NBC_01302]|uniref:hypothetical protein n=1 Tax=Kitasatospora sp. NBC_01302 TaxID=2903575 RepID=UPI002E1438F4|nr:hypothetical protein OG294_04420 [Kitasatospora sp. NBC_01302]
MAGKKRRKKPQPGRAADRTVTEPSRREARLLTKAGPTGVPADVSLRHGRIGCAVLGAAAAAGIAVPAVVERCGTVQAGEQFIGALTGTAATMLLMNRHNTGDPVIHGPDLRYLTARTLTGVRTVDLTALVRIRRDRVPGNRGWDDLVLTDARGVSLQVTGKQVAERLTALLQPQDGTTAQDLATAQDRATAQDLATARDGVPTGARISPQAAVFLGLATRSRRQHAVQSCADYLRSACLPMAGAGLAMLTTWFLGTA